MKLPQNRMEFGNNARLAQVFAECRVSVLSGEIQRGRGSVEAWKSAVSFFPVKEALDEELAVFSVVHGGGVVGSVLIVFPWQELIALDTPLFHALQVHVV